MAYKRDLEFLSRKMDQNMKEIEKEGKDMDKECRLKVIEDVMKVSLYKTFHVDLEFLNGQMD